MERQDTQPVFSEEEFNDILKENPELGLSYSELAMVNYNDDKVAQQQQGQLQNNMQQQQLNHHQYNNENLQINVPSMNNAYNPHQYFVMDVKQERDLPCITKDRLAKFFGDMGSTSGRRAPTPDEMLTAVPFSTINPSGNSNLVLAQHQVQVHMAGGPGVINQIPSGNSVAQARTLNRKCVSPDTQEIASYIIENMPEQHLSSYQQAAPQRPIDSKSNIKQETLSALQFNNDQELFDEPLIRSSSIDVNTLQNWPGKYGFSIELPINNDEKTKNKCCFSKVSDMMYVLPFINVEVRIKVTDWNFLGKAEVRLCVVYRDIHHRVEPVRRCPNCRRKMVGENSATFDHVVQVRDSKAEYSTTGDRFTVSVPINEPSFGQNFIPLLVCYCCMTSCTGGPNRRLYDTLFSLMVNGKEVGRHILQTKCCKAPARDKVHDEKPPKESKNQENTNNERESGSLVISIPNPSSKRKKKAAASSSVNVVSSSESDTDRANILSPHKRNKNAVVNNSNLLLAELPAQPGYCALTFPEKYKDKVKDYAAALIAKDKMTAVDPDYLQQN